tara:strand:+ start:285 stop:515 length:231 start_codon:yes stop_codon:yes gene_type:complete
VFTQEEHTLEVYRLIIGSDEAEAKAQGSISEYLLERGVFHANKLGRQNKKVKEFDIVKDPLAGGWILIFMCERCYF